MDRYECPCELCTEGRMRQINAEWQAERDRKRKLNDELVRNLPVREDTSWIDDTLAARQRTQRARATLRMMMAEDTAQIQQKREAESERQRKIVATVDDNLKRAGRRIAEAKREFAALDPSLRISVRMDIDRLVEQLLSF